MRLLETALLVINNVLAYGMRSECLQIKVYSFGSLLRLYTVFLSTITFCLH
jgi:hypothetical protein